MDQVRALPHRPRCSRASLAEAGHRAAGRTSRWSPDAQLRIRRPLWARDQSACAPRWRTRSGTPASTRRPRDAHALTPAAAAGHRAACWRPTASSKIYRRRKVVNDVALRLQQGEIVGLLGPNGAGKTTTFYMIVGLIQPLTGPHPAGRRGHHVHADVPAVSKGHRLPLPGALHLPEAVRRGQHRGHPGDAAALAGGAVQPPRDCCWTS